MRNSSIYCVPVLGVLFDQVKATVIQIYDPENKSVATLNPVINDSANFVKVIADAIKWLDLEARLRLSSPKTRLKVS